MSGALDLPAFCNALREIQYQARISVKYDREVTVAEIRQGLADFSETANQQKKGGANKKTMARSSAG